MMQQPTRHRAAPIYFLIACALYLVGSTFLGGEAFVYLSMGSLTLALLIGLATVYSGRTSVLSPLVALMVLFAFLNILLSTNRSDSALRWLLWFEMFIACGLLATQCEESVDRSLAALLPFGAVMVWLAKHSHAIGADTLPEDKAAAAHLSAFFAGVTVATGLFHPRVLWRWVFCAVGSYGVLVSGSRAAFLFFPLLFIAPALYYLRNRSAAIGALVFPIALLAVLFFNDNLRDLTFGRKAAAANRDAVSAAELSAGDRGALRELGYDYILDRPLGYGYGNTYSITGAAGKSRGTNFHNGYINVGAAMGAPFLLAYVWFNLWLLWSLYSERRAPRLFRHLFLSILVCVNLRAMTEDFTFFDLGNPICYVVVYLALVYLNKRRFMPVDLRE